MIRFLWPIFCFILGYFSYEVFFRKSAEPLGDDELLQVLRSKSGEATKLKSSFARVLPKMKSTFFAGRLEAGPHLVVVEPGENRMDIIDVVDRLQGFAGAKEQEGLDFARWALSSPSYTPDEKEKIFEESFQVLNASEISLLSEDIILNGAHQELVEKALSVRIQRLNQAQAEQVISYLWRRLNDEGIRIIVEDFASSHDLNLFP